MDLADAQRELASPSHSPLAPGSPVGRYDCARELCSYPNHQGAETPHYLHAALKRYGVEIAASSSGGRPVGDPPERFCPYCGHNRNTPHDPRCERYVSEAATFADVAPGQPIRGKGRAHKAG
jgi:hypothetical protein